MTLAYLEVGTCRSCEMPSFIYVDSNRESDQRLLCGRCITNYSNEVPTPVPAVVDEPLCMACGRPEMVSSYTGNRWELVSACNREGEDILVVHGACSTSNNCYTCDLNYATPRNRGWRTPDDTIYSTDFTVFETVEGDCYCSTCADKYMAERGGRDDFVNCEACEYVVHENNSSHWQGSQYCDNCYENNVHECGDCGSEYWDEHDCQAWEEDEDTGSIHSYSYRPKPYFFGEGKYHLGFELEVESRDESRYEGAQIAQDILGSHAYMKDDGSLSDGFEIVTHPHTLKSYQSEFNWDFIPKLKREGFRSWNTDTCGLHVHVSRTAFGSGEPTYGTFGSNRDRIILKRQAHELRFMKLVYDNQRQVERIAGRGNNHYATFQDRGKLVSKIKDGNQTNGRYSAINTENDATIEVRVFKGSLRKERVLSALEFVTASVEYTRDLKVTANNKALSWMCFTAFVSQNIETYPNLALIMSESFAGDVSPNEN